jgi:hypothetical protein
MRSFTDTKGRIWPIVINVAAVKRCRGLVGVDLYGLVENQFRPLADLLADPVKLVDVLYVLCMAEAESRGISDEQFGEGFAGDVLEAAADAFLEELTDFFQNPRVRAGLRKITTAARTVRDRLMDQMEAAMETIDAESAAAALIASSGSSPASSASTPAPSPSAS